MTTSTVPTEHLKFPTLNGFETRLESAVNNPLVQQTLRRRPAWLSAATVLLAASQMKPTPVTGTPAQVVADALAHAITNGVAVDDLDDVIATAYNRQAAAIVSADALRELRTGSVQTMNAELNAAVDQILADLNGRLEDLVEDVRAIVKAGRTADLATVEAAYAADRMDDYARLDAATSRYLAIREAQTKTLQINGPLSPLSTGGHIDLGETLTFADPLAIWPDWRVAKAYGPKQPVTEEKLTQPWPLKSFAGNQLGILTDLDVFRWAIANDAALWVPTQPQIEAATDKLREASRAATELVKPKSSGRGRPVSHAPMPPKGSNVAETIANHRAHRERNR